MISGTKTGKIGNLWGLYLHNESTFCQGVKCGFVPINGYFQMVQSKFLCLNFLRLRFWTPWRFVHIFTRSGLVDTFVGQLILKFVLATTLQYRYKPSGQYLSRYSAIKFGALFLAGTVGLAIVQFTSASAAVTSWLSALQDSQLPILSLPGPSHT